MSEFRENFEAGEIVVSISGEEAVKARWVHRVQPVLSDLHTSDPFRNFLKEQLGDWHICPEPAIIDAPQPKPEMAPQIASPIYSSDDDDPDGASAFYLLVSPVAAALAATLSFLLSWSFSTALLGYVGGGLCAIAIIATLRILSARADL